MSPMKENKSTAIIIGISTLILSFLVWFVYLRSFQRSHHLSHWVMLLPIFNASLNALTAFFLVLGFYFIRIGQKLTHRIFMYAATLTSAFFLIGYITYHHFQGDTPFVAHGPVRYLYFFILITHIIMSFVQVPLILGTHYMALVQNFVKHKSLARYTFPIWLYVSVTGVLVFVFLRYLNIN